MFWQYDIEETQFYNKITNQLSLNRQTTCAPSTLYQNIRGVTIRISLTDNITLQNFTANYRKGENFGLALLYIYIAWLIYWNENQ